MKRTVWIAFLIIIIAATMFTAGYYMRSEPEPQKPVAQQCYDMVEV